MGEVLPIEAKAMRAAAARARYASDPEYRERRKAQIRARSEAKRDEDRDAFREEENRRLREWRRAHPEEHRAQKARWNAGCRVRAQEHVAGLKAGQPCMDCGGSFPAVCMDYDHVHGEKSENVATLVAKGSSISLIDAEIAKCELVCANCHRLRTHSRRLDAAQTTEATA